MNEITVHVVERKGRPNRFMRYTDPVTGKQVSRSTGTQNRKEAELREGRYVTDARPKPKFKNGHP